MLQGANKGHDVKQVLIAEGGIAAFGRHPHAGRVQRVAGVTTNFDESHQFIIGVSGNELTGGHIFAQTLDTFPCRTMAGGACPGK